MQQEAKEPNGAFAGPGFDKNIKVAPRHLPEIIVGQLGNSS